MYHLVGISLFPVFSHYRHVAIPSVSLQIFLLIVTHNHSQHKEWFSLFLKHFEKVTRITGFQRANDGYIQSPRLEILKNIISIRNLNIYYLIFLWVTLYEIYLCVHFVIVLFKIKRTWHRFCCILLFQRSRTDLRVDLLTGMSMAEVEDHTINLVLFLHRKHIFVIWEGNYMTNFFSIVGREFGDLEGLDKDKG